MPRRRRFSRPGMQVIMTEHLSWPVFPAATTTMAPLTLTAKLMAAPTVASSIGRVDL